LQRGGNDSIEKNEREAETNVCPFQVSRVCGFLRHGFQKSGRIPQASGFRE